jgi:hypothetical protein
MSIRSNKPWLPIEPATLAELPGQLGVFEFADATGEVIFIGRADARTRFGLRGEVSDRAAALPQARAFRIEVTTAYHTRHLELLMVYRADYGRLPNCNEPMPTLGRLSPGPQTQPSR